MTDKLSILVADDQPSVRIPLTILMRRLGEVTVHSADRGQTAFDLAVAERPDLILLDVVMPDFDGYTVCRRIRSQSESYIPTIWLLTARNSQLDIEAAGEAGADRVITKPFDPDQLFNDVRDLRPRQSAA